MNEGIRIRKCMNNFKLLTVVRSQCDIYNFDAKKEAKKFTERTFDAKREAKDFLNALLMQKTELTSNNS